MVTVLIYNTSEQTLSFFQTGGSSKHLVVFVVMICCGLRGLMLLLSKMLARLYGLLVDLRQEGV